MSLADSPLHLVSPTTFADIRAFLTRVDYTAAGVCARLGMHGMHDYTALRDGRTTGTALDDPLDHVIRLFLDVEPVSRSALEQHIGAALLAAFRSAGMVEDVAPAAVQSTVLFYPLDGLWLVSDVAASMRPGTPDLDDVVYPAMTANTRRFLDGLPTSPTGTFLELCGGTGAAALLAAQRGTPAWTTDITVRSTAFAAFNAALNGIAGCTALAGDLYDAVPGQQFDRIAAHPPYVATPNSRVIFRDGGEDGESVTRRIVQGLPAALRPGGRCYLTCMATDRSDAPLEQRLRHWLGDGHEEFDVHLFVRTSFSPAEYYGKVAEDGAMTEAERDEWIAYFGRFGVTQLVYAWMILERHATVRPPITRRRIRVSDASQDEIEAIITWETRFEDPAARELVLSARPQLHPDVRLGAILRAEGGSWRPESVALESPSPFRAHVDLPVSVSPTVARLDGTRTPAELHAQAVALGEFLPESSVDDVIGILRQLLASGMVRVAEG